MKKAVVIHILFLTCVLLAIPSELAQGAFVEIPLTQELLDQIREGGFVLYMRHGKTDSSIPDQVPIDLEDCSTQRPLTEEGILEIAAIGQAIRQLGIPVGEIISSPLCRAKGSAAIAFGEDFEVNENLMYTAHLTTQQKAPIVAMTRQLVSTPVEVEGTNRVLVAHAPNIAEIMDYFPEVEGTVIIFKPLGQGEFQYVASILPTDWKAIIRNDGERYP